MVGLASHFDHGGAEDPALPPVAGAHDFRYFGLAGAVAGFVRNRVMHGRIEWTVQRVDSLKTLAFQRVEESGPDLLDLFSAAVGDGQISGVEHRQQLLDQTLGGPLEVFGLLAKHALLVVLEVGLQPPERVEIVVALLGDAGLLQDPFDVDRSVLGGHVHITLRRCWLWFAGLWFVGAGSRRLRLPRLWITLAAHARPRSPRRQPRHRWVPSHRPARHREHRGRHAHCHLPMWHRRTTWWPARRAASRAPGRPWRASRWPDG